MKLGSESHTFYLAPLRGVTVRAFRNLHAAWFAGPHIAVAPLIPTVAGPRVKEGLLSDIDPAVGQVPGLIPQVIGKDPAQLQQMLLAFRSLGYRRADLNVGCPYPFIIKKGRGAGLMRQRDNLARLLETGCAVMPAGFSIKVRLGIDDTALLAGLMDLINSFPLSEVAIHARTARQMYEGVVDLTAFAHAAALCVHPVVYNGDILSRDDWLRFKTQLPAISRWMVGRGVARNPFLFEELRSGAAAPDKATRLRSFLEQYLTQNQQELYGPASVLGRMKELWSYLHHCFPGGAALWRQVRICRSVPEYLSVLKGLNFEV